MFDAEMVKKKIPFEKKVDLENFWSKTKLDLENFWSKTKVDLENFWSKTKLELGNFHQNFVSARSLKMACLMQKW